jgi:hypothetical protein
MPRGGFVLACCCCGAPIRGAGFWRISIRDPRGRHARPFRGLLEYGGGEGAYRLKKSRWGRIRGHNCSTREMTDVPAKQRDGLPLDKRRSRGHRTSLVSQNPRPLLYPRPSADLRSARWPYLHAR